MRGIQGDRWIAFMRTAVSVAQPDGDLWRPFELESSLENRLCGYAAVRLYGVCLTVISSLGGWAAR
jgi:hypothetical protein